MTSQQLREELALLSTEMGELDQELVPLLMKRAKICSRLNKLRAPTSFLTAEILSLIFQHACFLPSFNDGEDPHLPIVLGSVSTHWREVAWTTPSLWTQLVVKADHPHHTSVDTLSLLRLYFGNAGKQSLSLRITVTFEEDCFGEDCFEEEYRTTPDPDTDDHVPIEDLLTLILEKREFITTLILECVPSDHCVMLLEQCPNLTYFRCPKIQWAQSKPQFDAPLVLKHTQTFGWTFGSDSYWDHALYTQMELPAVRHFISESRRPRDTTDIRVPFEKVCEIQHKFLSNLTTLEIFERISCHCPPMGAGNLFKCLPPSLRELRLLNISDPEQDEIWEFLTLDKPGQDNLVPHLRKLVMIGDFFRFISSRSKDCLVSLLEMLHSRREGPEEKWKTHSRLDCLYLGFNVREQKSDEYHEHRLGKSQQDSLQKFVGGGLELITADSDGVQEIWKGSSIRYISPPWLELLLPVV